MCTGVCVAVLVLMHLITEDIFLLPLSQCKKCADGDIGHKCSAGWMDGWSLGGWQTLDIITLLVNGGN